MFDLFRHDRVHSGRRISPSRPAYCEFQQRESFPAKDEREKGDGGGWVGGGRHHHLAIDARLTLRLSIITLLSLVHLYTPTSYKVV